MDHNLLTHKFAIDLGGIQVETLQSVSGLTYGQDVVEIKQVTADGELLNRKQPGPAQTGQVTITRGMDKSRAFTDWIKTTRENHDHGSARQNVTIALLDPGHNVVNRIHLVNAWASSWTAADLDAESSGAAIETVNIEFDDMVIE
ncbi:phage tail protein [Streptomyces nigrescens]